MLTANGFFMGLCMRRLEIGLRLAACLFPHYLPLSAAVISTPSVGVGGGAGVQTLVSSLLVADDGV